MGGEERKGSYIGIFPKSRRARARGREKGEREYFRDYIVFSDSATRKGSKETQCRASQTENEGIPRLQR